VTDEPTNRDVVRWFFASRYARRGDLVADTFAGYGGKTWVLLRSGGWPLALRRDGSPRVLVNVHPYNAMTSRHGALIVEEVERRGCECCPVDHATMHKLIAERLPDPSRGETTTS
jgi:hypothetical protein